MFLFLVLCGSSNFTGNFMFTNTIIEIIINILNRTAVRGVRRCFEDLRQLYILTILSFFGLCAWGHYLNKTKPTCKFSRKIRIYISWSILPSINTKEPTRCAEKQYETITDPSPYLTVNRCIYIFPLKLYVELLPHFLFTIVLKNIIFRFIYRNGGIIKTFILYWGILKVSIVVNFGTLNFTGCFDGSLHTPFWF